MDDKITVCMVAPGGVEGKGGMGRLVRYIARGWPAGPGWPALRVLDGYGTRPGAMPLAFARTLGTVAGAAARGRIGILHLHMAAYGSVPRKLTHLLAAKALGVPVVLHLHAGRFAEFFDRLPGAGRRLLRAIMSMADAIIVLGDVWRDVLVKDVGIDPARITVLANGVDGPETVPERTGTGPCRILFLGKVVPLKGMGELLQALARIDTPDLAWAAEIAGDGEVETYRRLAEELGLGERVRFLGWVEEQDVQERLDRADILALPSHHEGLPMCVLEAMARGATVVATPVGAIPDAVADGQTGLLVPVKDIAGLADALRRLIADPQERRAFARKAHARYRERYSLDSMRRNLLTIYQGVLERRSGTVTMADRNKA